MLRYDRTERNSPQDAPNYLARREQWRVMRLVIALGLVVILMGQLRGSRGAKVLGIFFGRPDAADQNLGRRDGSTLSRSAPELSVAFAKPELPPGTKVELGGLVALPVADGVEARDELSSPVVNGLDNIRDNAAFRSEDTAPWFQLLGALYVASQRQLENHSLGDLTPLQLLEQPEAYRGRLVTIRGTARQSIATDPLDAAPTDEDLGRLSLCPEVAFPAQTVRTFLTTTFLADYHRIAIQQEGASVPVVVFALEVPDGFPRGETIREPVFVTGYFFKNWLYSTGEGVSVGPVILAKGVGWVPKSAATALVPEANSREVLITFVAAALLGVIATWWLWRRSQAVDALPPGRASSSPAAPDFSRIHANAPREGEAFGEPS